jgi:hypothetical protein
MIDHGEHPVAETLRQAQRWDVVKFRYIDAGLCERCAAQLAWGHQDNAGGWTDLRPPCVGCAPLVRELPVATTNPLWRRFLRPQDHKRIPAQPATPPDGVEDVCAQHTQREEVLL